MTKYNSFFKQQVIELYPQNNKTSLVIMICDDNNLQKALKI